MDNPTNPEILFEQWLGDSWEEILKISGQASSSRSIQTSWLIPLLFLHVSPKYHENRLSSFCLRKKKITNANENMNSLVKAIIYKKD